MTLSVQPPGAPLNVTITSPNQIVNAGSAAVINATAVGTTLTYFWTLNGSPLSDGGSVSGSSTSALTISPAFATFNGTYTVTASNSFGKVAANNSVTLKVIDPVITVQPVGATNLPNTSTSLSVTAFGAPALTYQWLSNGVAIAGATTSNLNFVNTGTVSSGSFSVIVSNSQGSSVTSAVTVVSFSPFLLNDTFSYVNGNLFGDPGSPGGPTSTAAILSWSSMAGCRSAKPTPPPMRRAFSRGRSATLSSGPVSSSICPPCPPTRAGLTSRTSRTIISAFTAGCSR